ncbi:class II aldolase/adducin family protein [bacterium]|nr:class II aldolase/adducin family protein [bacterium]MBU1982857.1 class II aldolase/adducin family protein [bacterium]
MHELIHAAAVLHRARCLPATDGNLSARLDQRRVVITKAGIEKRELVENSFVVTSLDEPIPEHVSSEWPMHRAIYLARSDVGCILHVHAPFLSSFAIAGHIPDVNLLTETQLLIGQITLVPFAVPGSNALAESLLAQSPTANVYLLANHGVVAVGQTAAIALHRLERAEFLAEISIHAAAIGGGIPLNAAQISELETAYSKRSSC